MAQVIFDILRTFLLLKQRVCEISYSIWGWRYILKHRSYATVYNLLKYAIILKLPQNCSSKIRLIDANPKIETAFSFRSQFFIRNCFWFLYKLYFFNHIFLKYNKILIINWSCNCNYRNNISCFHFRSYYECTCQFCLRHKFNNIINHPYNKYFTYTSQIYKLQRNLFFIHQYVPSLFLSYLVFVKAF